jgi:hypothetical protein
MAEFILASLLYLLAVIAVWLLRHTLVNRLGGLRVRLQVDTGPLLRTSRWGDADVNGVGF